MHDHSRKIAIIAALERELSPLVRNWDKKTVQYERCVFNFFESGYAVAICGGIGAESARHAAEVAITNYSPRILISAGVAGALVPELTIGETIFPALVIDTQDGSRHETAIQDSPIASSPLARCILATYPEVASTAQKQQLAKSYSAHAVDMEAAAVALAAEKHGIPFIAIKAISDDQSFEFPEMNRFIHGGKFQTSRFVLNVILRPWLWLRVFRLARNTNLASVNLCAWLRESALTNTIVTSTQPKS